jgi:hypothetical protein
VVVSIDRPPSGPRRKPRARDFIKVSCGHPGCGARIDVAPVQLRLVLCSHEPWSFYAFECTACGREVHKPVDGELVAALAAARVPVERWHVPAEAAEPKHGPRLSMDDYLDFMADLWVDDADLAAAALSERAR